MPESKLYGQLNTVENPDSGFDEFIPVDPENPYDSFTGDEVMLLNINGIIKGIRAKWFRGKTGDQGLPGDVAWGELTVSAIGAALVTATTAAAQRLVIGMSALGSQLVVASTASAMRALLDLGNSVIYDFGHEVSTVAQGNDYRFVPAKCPIPFYDDAENVPDGWYICDGTNGTPDLRNKMIMGVGSLYALGDTGGSKDAIVVEHSHSGTTESDGEHFHTYQFPAGRNNANSGSDTDDYYYQQQRAPVVQDTSIEGEHTHVFETDLEGSSGSDANLPPFFAMNYIMHF